MTELANCPLCGKGPMIYHYTYIPFAYECCGVQCYSIEKWNRYAAAMELAEAKTWEEETYSVLCWLAELQDRKCAFNESVDLNIYAERAGFDALEKMYEVFK